MRVLSYYLAGWHIKPKGVKKPSVPNYDSRCHHLNIHYRYNPVLGEFFRCRYDYSNGTQGFYIAEQGKFLSVSNPSVHLTDESSSLPPSSNLRFLLHFSCESREHHW